MKIIKYRTKENQRWDQVSFENYGTPFQAQRIIDNNPNIPISERLAGGILLEIPILDNEESLINKNALPPWKK